MRVTTQCMYPSNGLVTVSVRAGKRTAVISDEGGALSEVTSAGIVNRPSDRQLSHLIEEQGLVIKGGIVMSPPVPIEAAPAAIILVANAAKDVVGWFYSNARIKVKRDFQKALAQVLDATFDKKVNHGVPIQGKFKSHKFANVIRLPGTKSLLVDGVANEASSICARVVSNMDVREAGNDDIIQRLVYDDDNDKEKWKPDDLALLGMSGVPAISFSRSSEIIRDVVSRYAKG